MEPNLQFTSPEGVLVKIWYERVVEDTISVPTLLKCLAKLKKNLSVLPIDILQDLTLEIWNPANPACPRSETGTLRIDRAAGLAYSWLRKIQLNSKFCNDKDLPAVLSHEVGHILARAIGFDDPASLFRVNWDKFRAAEATPDTPVGELFAEDVMDMFGAEGAENLERTDKYKFIPASSKESYESWFTVLAKLQVGGIPASTEIKWNKGCTEAYWSKGNLLFPWTYKLYKATAKDFFEWSVWSLSWKRI